MGSKYQRVLLKISGEALAGEAGFGIDEAMLADVASQVKEIHDLGIEVAIVVGGGNFWRGRTGKSIDRVTADYMGMMATTMNAMAIADALQKHEVETVLQTSISMDQISEPINRKKALAHLAQKRIVVFGTGTGLPFFSTDTTAALRAAEIDADVILLAKNIDAVYSEDPNINPDAARYDELTHLEVIERQLGVMDITAATLCMENGIKIHVFALAEKGNLLKAAKGEKIGTIIV